MRIVCSWCRGEGHKGIVGEKAPLEDLRETHGICLTHRIAVQARWKEACRESGVIDSHLMRVAETKESSEAGGHIALSAAHLWAGLRNLTRKPRP